MSELPAENDAWQDTTLQSSKYLNNLIEQDHCGVKLCIGPMPELADIELLHRIHKKQFT